MTETTTRAAPTRHIISVLLENEAGALSRVVGLFSARGYNIETLTVAPTEDPTLSRMTIVTTGSDEVIEQITKHLNRPVELTGAADKLDAFLQAIDRSAILETVRTGASGIGRGERILKL